MKGSGSSKRTPLNLLGNLGGAFYWDIYENCTVWSAQII